MPAASSSVGSSGVARDAARSTTLSRATAPTSAIATPAVFAAAGGSDRRSLRTFRRDVARGPEDEARLRLHRLLAEAHLRDPEVEDLHPIADLGATHEHHVLRLEIAMDDPARVPFPDGVADL